MASHGEGTTWLILNGKSAQQPEIRSAVTSLRERGHDLAVRVTWGGGTGLGWSTKRWRRAPPG
ncbi:hypothetical protein [Salinicola tamaricis]|uniref:hypothetical protein n=1 Tax=Salinicola tamaricis TaxID=1771309 RepID=UPI0030F45400